MIPEGLEGRISSAEVVAFDVFDTLVTRPFLRPDHLFFYLERKYGVPGFAKARIDAERLARRKVRQEVDLDGIYAVLGHGDMKEREVSEEISLCRADPDIRDLWGLAVSSGKRIVLVSDMYLPSDVISRMLEHCGFSGWSKIYISCEHSVGKTDGGLYDIICRECGVDPPDVLMIGDNRHSDVDMAGTKGMETFRWIPMHERYAKTHPAEYRAGRADPEVSAIAGLDMQFSHAADEDYWHMVGRRFAGPLLMGFALFIMDHEQDADRLLFCSRDGYMAMKAYQFLGGRKDVRYVYSSRFLSLVYSGDDLEEKLSEEYLKVQGTRPSDVSALLNERSKEYSDYLCGVLDGSEHPMLVDSTTMMFSAQRDIEKRTGRKLKGCYYTVMKDSDLDYAAFADRSREHISWSYVNFCEMVMSSDEPPVRDMVDGRPVYSVPLEDEKERISHCHELQDGMMAYLEDCRRYFGEELPRFSSAAIDRWLDSLFEEERRHDGTLWRMQWPSDDSNTGYVDLLFRPRDIMQVARCKVGGMIKKRE